MLIISLSMKWSRLFVLLASSWYVNVLAAINLTDNSADLTPDLTTNHRQLFTTISDDNRYQFYEMDINGDGLTDKIMTEQSFDAQRKSEATSVTLYTAVNPMHYAKHSVIDDVSADGQYHVLDILPRHDFLGFIVFSVAAQRRSPFVIFYVINHHEQWVISKFSVSGDNFAENGNYYCLHELTPPLPFSQLSEKMVSETVPNANVLANCPAEPLLSAFYEITTDTELLDEQFKATQPPTYLSAGTIVESDIRNEDWLGVMPPQYLHEEHSVKFSGWVDRRHVKPRDDIYP